MNNSLLDCLCEKLARQCRDLDNSCVLYGRYKCPIPIRCSKITPEIWKKLLIESVEELKPKRKNAYIGFYRNKKQI